jgi:hypothetical protein
MSMLVLESQDAEADAALFEAAGIGGFDKVSFTRLGKRPDGSTVHVAFSLAFARDRLAPECGFFVCQQHYPENFWNPAFQQHPNGAAGIAGVLMIAENPSAHAEFLYHFTGEHDLVSNSAGIAVETERGTIDVMTSAALRFHTGIGMTDEPARFAGYRVAVADPGAVADRLRLEGVPFSLHHGTIVVAPENAFGTVIVFQQAT